jgi:hypothetical protein
MGTIFYICIFQTKTSEKNPSNLFNHLLLQNFHQYLFQRGENDNRLQVIIKGSYAICCALMMDIEQLHQCSVCGPTKENWMKKSHNMPVWLSKMLLAQHFPIGC